MNRPSCKYCGCERGPAGEHWLLHHPESVPSKAIWISECPPCRVARIEREYQTAMRDVLALAKVWRDSPGDWTSAALMAAVDKLEPFNQAKRDFEAFAENVGSKGSAVTKPSRKYHGT